MVPGRCRAVIPDRDRKKMEHQIRVRDALVATRESSDLEVVRRARAAPEEEPLGADPGPIPPFQRRRDRHRLRARVLDVDLEMVLQVLTDAGKLLHHVGIEGPQFVGIANARQLQQVRRVEGASTQDDLASMHLTITPRSFGLDPDGPPAFEEDLGHERPALDVEVRPAHHRVQVGTGRSEAPAPVNVPVKGRESLLAIAVHVRGELVAGLLHSLEESLEERAVGGTSFKYEWTIRSSVLVTAGET